MYHKLLVGSYQLNQFNMVTTKCASQGANGTIQLRHHQIGVAHTLLSRHGILAAHSTGTGKTITSAAAAACLLSANIVNNIVVLAKKSALAQFDAEVRRFWQGSPFEDAPLQCLTHVTFFRDPSRYAPHPDKTLLIIDEAHEFVNPEASSTRQLIDLAATTARVLLLTATPITNTLYDLVSLVAMVRGTTELMSPVEYEQNVLKSASGFRSFFKNAIDLHIVDKNADSHYPRVDVHRVSIPMSDETIKIYKSMPRAAFDINLRQLSLGSVAGVASKCEKCLWLTQNIKKWIARGEDKIVLYTAFLDAGAKTMTALLKQQGVNTLVLDGSTGASKRRAAALMFNRPSSIEKEGTRDLRSLVVSNINSASADLNANKLNTNTKTNQRCGKDGIIIQRNTSGNWFTSIGARAKISEEKANLHLEGLPPVPPKWTEVEVCRPGARGGLAWVAKDLKGRWQYRYTEDWSIQQEYLKIVRLKFMNEDFWRKFNRKVDGDMVLNMVLKGNATIPANFMLASATKLLQTCHFRAGSHETDNDHYGLMTLRASHVQVASNGDVTISFVGKAGKTNLCTVSLHTDNKLAVALSTLRRNAKSPDSPMFGTLSATSLRAYLSQIHDGLRPKDFRTYHANHVLVDHLRQKPWPSDMTVAQRRKRINEAVKEASRGLNNTPEVCKRSYVFSGLWVLYLADPRAFGKVLYGVSERASTADVLAAFVAHFDKNSVDWQHMLQRFRETKGIADFSGAANVLLITDAGAESIDLAGVRHIVLIDPVWTPAMEDQIIGRGQRYNSHAALPPAHRVVHVWKLLLDTPNNQPKSIERHMDELVISKRNQQTDFLRRIARL